MGARLGEVEPNRIKLGYVSGQDIALAGIVSLDDVIQLWGFDLLVFYVVGAEIIGEVELRGGVGLHADLAALERQRGIDVSLGRNHEAFAVIIGHGRKIEIVRGL